MTKVIDLLRMPRLFEAAQSLRDKYDKRIDAGINDHLTCIYDWAWIKATKEILDMGMGTPFLSSCEETDWIYEMYEEKKDIYHIYDLAADKAIQDALAG